MEKNETVIPIVQEDDSIDVRIKNLSYSSLLTLHTCPRKFQLNRLKAQLNEMEPTAAINQNITFAYGHVVGEGIQLVMEGKSEEEVIWRMFQAWHADLEDRNPKQNKSFYGTVAAIQRFISMRDNGFLEDWELVYWNGKPAVELSFRISFPGGFKLRGALDAVLRNKYTGEIRVLECKTDSSLNVEPLKYKNSAQGIGYSVVLDVIFPGLTSYEVLYLVYMSKSGDYEALPFVKTHLMRAKWIQELLLDIECIKMYENVGVYPSRGESCLDFFRPCEYEQTCSLSTKFLAAPLLKEHLDTKVYDVELTLDDLIKGQLDRIDDVYETPTPQQIGTMQKAVAGNSQSVEDFLDGDILL